MLVLVVVLVAALLASGVTNRIGGGIGDAVASVFNGEPANPGAPAEGSGGDTGAGAAENDSAAFTGLIRALQLVGAPFQRLGVFVPVRTDQQQRHGRFTQQHGIIGAL